MILSDLGADVIKIEDPRVGDYIRFFPPYKDGISVFHHALNRGKKSIALDLKKEEDRNKFYKLVKHADVIVESFREGVAEKLGVDFLTLKKYNPKLVYCSIRGIVRGSAGRPIHDLNAQALSGILDIHRKAYGENVVPLIPIGDLSAGVMCAIAILAGINYSQRNDKAVKLDVGMVESALLFNIVPLLTILNNGKIDEIIGGKPKSYYSVMKTKDNVHYSVAPIEEKFWELFEKLIGMKIDNRDTDEAYQKTLKAFSKLTSREVEEYIEKNPCCVEKVIDIELTPKVRGLEDLFDDVNGVKVLKTPIFVNKEIKAKIGKAPELGENNKLIDELQG